MRLGFTSMNNPGDPPPAELAVELVERGFESLWTGEHSHIPASRKTPYPAGGEMPEPYRAMMNPFLSLLAAALAAPELLVGTSVALPLEHDLFDLAKTVATIDHLTSGRFHLGVGVGWNEEELADHRRVPWSMRYVALRECIAALRVLWTESEAEFHGSYFAFEPVWSYPKPLQEPHPPLLCGMSGPTGVREAIEWSDGWMPMDVVLGDVARRIELFRARAETAGRDPDSLPVSLIIFGDPDVEKLVSYRSLGVERVVIGSARTGWADPATLESWLDRYDGLAAAVA